VKNHRAITILLLFTFIFVDITLCSFTNKDNFVDSKNHGEQDLKKIQNFISQWKFRIPRYTSKYCSYLYKGKI